MKLPIRYFSIGLLTASAIMLVMFLISDDAGQDAEALTVEELSIALEQKGYRIINEDDFISYSLYLDEEDTKKVEVDEKQSDSSKVEKKKDKDKKDNENKNNKDEKDKKDKKDENDEKDEKDKEKSKSVTISVEEGFVSQDIAQALKNEDIIDDEAEFVKYMEDNGYSAYIQIGKFKVKSDMSLKKLAETLTTYPGN